jgi:hypothetical protein
VTAGRGFDLAGAIGGVLDRLRAAGIRAVADVRDVNPPCVYVPPPQIGWSKLGKGYVDLLWTVAAVVPATGRDIALKNLGPLMLGVADALTATPLTVATPIDLGGVDGAAPMPAYELTFTTRYLLERTAP